MKTKLFIIFVAAYLLTGCAGAISKKHYKELGDLLYSLDNRNKLIEMAEKRFGKLTEADKKLFNAVAAAENANYAEGGDKDKPEDANIWGEKRIIDANRIEWLCHDRQAKELVTDKGIWVTGAKIEGAVDLSFAEISFPLCFQGCVFNEEIIILYSRIKFFNLMGSHTDSILADGVKVEGSVFLRNGFKAKGEVRFVGAAIGGDFDCENGEFIKKDGFAILADGMEVRGKVFLRNGFKAEGEVSFTGAVIGGSFECENGEFINKGGRAIRANGMDVKKSVSLRNGFKAEGEVRFLEAAIGGDFVCEKGEFINKGGRAIQADGMDVKGCVFLRNGFKAEGEVRFLGVAIGGAFDCTDGNFIKGKEYAISADGMDVKGSVFLRNGFKSEGEVSFSGAVIGGNFECNNGKFINKGGKAISADGMDVKGCVFLRNGFKSEGEIRFSVAAIDGDFVCDKGEFINKDGFAISADGMEVKGNVFLREGFRAEGRVSLVGATVGGHFFWSNVNLTEKTILDLRNAKAGVLWDDEKSWPAKGNLFLDGFIYENIGDYAPKDARSRIEWLNRQGEERFRPGPYEQLAKVLEKIGHNEDAIKILIEKEERLTRLSSFGWWTRLWKGTTIGYGYRPWRALRFIVPFILFGCIVFWRGYKTGVIIQADKEAYYKFNALIYSIEMFVPVVDLRMKKYWMPDANKLWGAIIRGYMWIHISAGWIFTTLLIAGLTGLIKK